MVLDLEELDYWGIRFLNPRFWGTRFWYPMDIWVRYYIFKCVLELEPKVPILICKVTGKTGRITVSLYSRLKACKKKTNIEIFYNIPAFNIEQKMRINNRASAARF